MVQKFYILHIPLFNFLNCLKVISRLEADTVVPLGNSDLLKMCKIQFFLKM